LRLDTRPDPTGFELNAKTMGMVLIALRSAKAAVAVTPIKTSHFKSTSCFANKSTISKFSLKNRSSKMRLPSG
jgi:hypothetical protein